MSLFKTTGIHLSQIYNSDFFVFFSTGTEIDVDSYSAFWDNSRSFHTGLTAALRERGINTVYVVGLAYDLCVTCTALDSVSEG